jgi:CDP-6-deoxy-D-xylo-4-hexulose-3-dehydrase
MNKDPAELKAEILKLTRQYSELMHKGNRPGAENVTPFEPGVSHLPYSARVFNGDEVAAGVGSMLDFWLTLGAEGAAFESELARLLGVRHSLLVNSGSSANLLAITALTSHKLPPQKRLRPGHEVITVAAGFPTTVAPIIQNQLVPVFIDANPLTGNADVAQLEAAFREGKTKAVMMAHTLGNPFDIGAVLEFCRRHDLWLVEDNCDALGCVYTMPVARARALKLDHLFKTAEAGTSPLYKLTETHITAPTGAWGDISTQSFYPPHHLTLGEGGAVNIITNAALKSYVESFRDWGRDCWCPSGKDNTCRRRYDWQLGELPKGYDHKYIYSHLGYNLKPLDPQAAIGRAQLKKLPAFIQARKDNWNTLRAGLAPLSKYVDFTLPTHATAWNDGGFSWDETSCRVDCSWFGFMIRVKPGAPFTHSDIGRELDRNKIGNRMLFGGNLVKQPAFVQLKKDNPDAFRVVGSLSGSDALMNSAIFLGTYPGLTKKMLDFEMDVLRKFAAGY